MADRGTFPSVALIALLVAPVVASAVSPPDLPPGLLPPGLLPPVELAMGVIVPRWPLEEWETNWTLAAELAASDVNASGGGVVVRVIVDRATFASEAVSAWERVLAGGAVAVVGPCCSAGVEPLLARAKANATPLASPSATFPGLTLENENDGWFWRVSPGDQRAVEEVARMAAEDGHARVVVHTDATPYGDSLAEAFTDAYEAEGGFVARVVRHRPDTDVADAAAATCTGQAPSAVVHILDFERTAATFGAILGACATAPAGFGWDYFDPDAFAALAGYAEDGTSLVAGFRGVNGRVGPVEAWPWPTSYSAQVYDAVAGLALAAIAGRDPLSLDPPDGGTIRDHLLDVLNPPGLACSTVEECVAALAQGADVDYVGKSVDWRYDERREPEDPTFALWRIESNGSVTWS